MARIRMVKPEFFDDPDMGEISPLARLLFIGLWTQSDKEGRLEADLRRLKARLFPYDTIEIEQLADELVAKDMIRRYTESGHSYIWIRNFVKHQRPHPKEPESLIPAWSQQAAIKHGESWKKTADPSESGVLILDPLTGSSLTESGTRNLDSGTRKLEHAVKDTASPAANGNGHELAARSKRPIYQSDRFVVFEWQLDDLSRQLGPHTLNFDLHAFFDGLSQNSRQRGLIIPTNGRNGKFWEWLQAQVQAEAERRGMEIASVPFESKQTQQLKQSSREFLSRGAGPKNLRSDL